MRGITSGLQPRRYADGDLVQKALDLGVTPFGMSDEEIMKAIVEKKQTDEISAGGDQGVNFTDQQFKDNFFDYTDPLEYATLPLVSLRAAKLAGKAGKGIYNTVRGPASQLGGKISQNIRGIGAYIGSDILARDVLGYQNPFGEEAKQARQDAQDEAAEDLKFMTGKLEGEDFVDFELDGGEAIDITEKSPEEIAEDIGNKPTPTEKEKEEEEKKKNFLSKMGKVFEDYGASQGDGSAPKGIASNMIRGTAINTPEITRYQNGGIADMMPQEPMMMADGGIAHFAFGGAAIKKAIKAGVEKGIGVFNKAKKSTAKETKKIKEERKVKPRSTKKSDSKDLVLYDEAAAKAAAPTRTRGYLDFLPAPIAGVGVAAGKGVGQAGRALYDLKKPLAPYGALAATGLGIATYANSGDPEPTAEEIAKAKKDAAQAKAKADLEERQAAREGLTALPEIRAARALERAEEAGRTEANFVDYVATFPASYTEKIGKDPEFAKQMMAGFIAMAKPTEGFVPRNAFVDFGEAAMAEGARQEGEVPDQIKLLEAIEENPDLLKSMRKLNEKTSDPITDAKNLSGLKDLLLADLYGENNYDEDDVILDARTGAEISDLQLLQMYKDSGEDLNVVRSNIMPKAKV